MKNLIKVLLPICGATLSALPLTLVSCNPNQSEDYIELNKWNKEWEGGHYLESKAVSLKAGVEYSCIIDYSKWEDDWNKRPDFSYTADSGGYVHSTWIEAQRAWLKTNDEWVKIDPENFQLYEAMGFIVLKPDYSKKLGHNAVIKIDIIPTTTAKYVFSAH